MCIGDFSRRAQRQPYFLRQLNQPVQNGSLFSTRCIKYNEQLAINNFKAAKIGVAHQKTAFLVKTIPKPRAMNAVSQEKITGICFLILFAGVKI